MGKCCPRPAGYVLSCHGLLPPEQQPPRHQLEAGGHRDLRTDHVRHGRAEHAGGRAAGFLGPFRDHDPPLFLQPFQAQQKRALPFPKICSAGCWPLWPWPAFISALSAARSSRCRRWRIFAVAGAHCGDDKSVAEKEPGAAEMDHPGGLYRTDRVGLHALVLSPRYSKALYPPFPAPS